MTDLEKTGLEFATGLEAVTEETGVLTDMNPALPVLLKENLRPRGMDNPQYQEHARNVVTSFFKRENWRYREVLTQSDLIVWELGLSNDRVTIRMRVAVESDPRVCRIDAIMPTSVDPVYDAILCKEIVRLNQPLRYGAFQYDESDGELSYRYSFPANNGIYCDDLEKTFLAVMLTAQREFLKLQKYAVGKFTKAETEQIRQYIGRLTKELELEN